MSITVMHTYTYVAVLCQSKQNVAQLSSTTSDYHRKPITQRPSFVISGTYFFSFLATITQQNIKVLPDCWLSLLSAKNGCLLGLCMTPRTVLCRPGRQVWCLLGYRQIKHGMAYLTCHP